MRENDGTPPEPKGGLDRIRAYFEEPLDGAEIALLPPEVRPLLGKFKVVARSSSTGSPESPDPDGYVRTTHEIHEVYGMKGAPAAGMPSLNDILKEFAAAVAQSPPGVIGIHGVDYEERTQYDAKTGHVRRDYLLVQSFHTSDTFLAASDPHAWVLPEGPLALLSSANDVRFHVKYS